MGGVCSAGEVIENEKAGKKTSRVSGEIDPVKSFGKQKEDRGSPTSGNDCRKTPQKCYKEEIRVVDSSDFKTRTPSRKGSSKTKEKSSFLGKTSNSNIKKAVKALETLGSNVSNINPAKVFNFGTSSKGNNIAILAFEVANTIAKAEALLESLSENHIKLLKKEILSSEGVEQLVSTDMQELMSIAAADKREEFDVFVRELIRFGELCKDPQWHNLSQHFLKLESRQLSNPIHREEAETTMKELNSLARHTSELYHELNALDRFERDYRCKSEEAESLDLHQEGEDLQMLQDELKHRRQHIKSLKKKSLWSRNMEEIMVKLLNIVIYIHEQIVAAFGVNGLPSMKKDAEEPRKSPMRLGESGLALHYANIITQIDTRASHPAAFPPNARDMLYNALPTSVKKALKSQLQNVEANNQTRSISHVKAEMDKTLKWLVPLATNTVKAHQEFGWIGEWANIGKQSRGKLLTRHNLIPLQTLHHADKEKADAYILQLVALLHNLISLVKQRVAFRLPPVKSPIRQGVKSQYRLQNFSSLNYSPGTSTRTIETTINRNEPSPHRSVPGTSSTLESSLLGERRRELCHTSRNGESVNSPSRHLNSTDMDGCNG